MTSNARQVASTALGGWAEDDLVRVPDPLPQEVLKSDGKPV